MAILKMQHISIFGLKKNRKAIIELLQRSGVVEIDDILKEDSIFKKTDMSSAKAIFEKNVALSEQSLSILQEFSPEEKSVFAMFEGKRPVSVENYYTFSYERDEVMRVVFRLVALSKEISEKRADIIKYKTQSEALIPWLALDISMRFKGTKNTASFIGSFPREMTQDAILEGLASDKISAVNVDIVSASKEQTCVFILCSKLEKDAVQEALRAMDFSEPAAPSKEAPSVLKAQLEERISTAEKNIEVAVEEIFSYSGMRNAIKFMADYYRCRADKYEV
ncbi:MAG: V-type ATP synthase subunit I, partial [Oscillospiraceae bacterium]